MTFIILCMKIFIRCTEITMTKVISHMSKIHVIGHSVTYRVFSDMTMVTISSKFTAAYLEINPDSTFSFQYICR